MLPDARNKHLAIPVVSTATAVPPARQRQNREHTAWLGLINWVSIGGLYGEKEISAPRIDMTWNFEGYPVDDELRPLPRRGCRSPWWRSRKAVRTGISVLGLRPCCPRTRRLPAGTRSQQGPVPCQRPRVVVPQDTRARLVTRLSSRLIRRLVWTLLIGQKVFDVSPASIMAADSANSARSFTALLPRR